MGHRSPSTAGAPSVREANAAWGRFSPAGATLSLNAALGRSGSTSSVGCETPLFGDHPPPRSLSQILSLTLQSRRLIKLSSLFVIIKDIGAGFSQQQLRDSALWKPPALLSA